MLPIKAFRDPAPSRWKYRLDRFRLTKTYRVLVRYCLPYSVAIALGWSIFSSETFSDVVETASLQLRDTIAERPELTLTKLELSGVSDYLRPDMMAAIDVTLPVSALDIDVGAMRARIDGIDAVKRSVVRAVAGGVLKVHIQERPAALIWRTEDGLHLLDQNGIKTGKIPTRSVRPELLIIAGAGADKLVDEALGLMQTGKPIAQRIRGLVLVGERRWDVVLDHNQRIMLPEIGADAALVRVLALDKADDILNRDIAVVDMRDKHRPILRISAYAMEELRRLRNPSDEEKT